MLIIPLNLDSVLLLLHNSKLAYCFSSGMLIVNIHYKRNNTIILIEHFTAAA